MTRLTRAFGVLSKNVAKNPDLSASAKGLYALLCAYADDDGVCWPSNETLAKEMGGVTERAVQKWLTELSEAGVLVREPRFEDNRQTTSITRLTDASSSPRPEPQFTPGGEPQFIQNKTTRNKTSKDSLAGEQRTPRKSARIVDTPEFEEWWRTYPYRQSKGDARVAYAKALTKIDAPSLLAALQARVPQLTRAMKGGEGGKNICPYPATWLNRERWEDDVVRETKAERDKREGWTI